MDLSPSLAILSIFLLQVALAHAVGLLMGTLFRQNTDTARSWTLSLLAVAFLSLISSWTALVNIQALLAPSFTFVSGSVVMTNPYLAVVLVYAACAGLSIGLLFVNVERFREEDMSLRSAKTFSVTSSAVLGLFFLALGVLSAL